MKTKSIVLLAMALGCGLVAMLGVQQILSTEKKTQDTVTVLVARQDIAAGVRIDPAFVAFEEWPKDSAPPGAVTDAAQFEDRALKVKAFPGDVILQAKLGEKGQFGASPSIPKGLRVVTVPVNMTTVHSGMVRAGDRVDVLVTYSIRRPGQPEIQRTKTVLEYIEVFAIDRVREGEGGDSEKGTKAENLSVLVTPEQAHVLMLGASKGKLQMALRNSEDKEQAQIAAVDDSIFDEIKASKGMEGDDDEEETESARPAGETKAPTTDFNKFLAESGEESPGPAAAAVPAEEVWAIEIFEGDKRRVEQVRLPAKNGGPASAPASAPADGVTETSVIESA